MLERDGAVLPLALRPVLDHLYTHVSAIQRARIPLEDVGEHRRQQVLSVLSKVAGRPIVAEDLQASIEQIMEVENTLVREFVLGQFEHQYTPDGKLHLSDPLGLALIAFYPDWEFRGDTVHQVNQDQRIMSIRSYRALFRLITGAWLLGLQQEVELANTRIEIITSYFESELFETPNHINTDWVSGKNREIPTMYVRTDPDRGFAFMQLVSAEELRLLPKGAVISKVSAMSRFVPVANGNAVAYIPNLNLSRPKGVVPQIRKHLLGRAINDGVGVRILVFSRAEYERLQPKFKRVIYDHGIAETVDGVLLANVRPNLTSVASAGVHWQGNVTIGNDTAEAQIVSFETDWNRTKSLLPETEVWYKSKQWLLQAKDDPDVINPLPPLIQLVFPPTLHPEWTQWAHIVDVLCYRLDRAASKHFPGHFVERGAWINRVRSVLMRRHHEWSLDVKAKDLLPKK